MTVDPDGPIDDVEVTGFDGLLAVVEHGGTYVGRVTLPADRLARDGHIAGATIRREVRTALWSELWAAALRERLHRRIASQWWEHVPHASVTVAVCTRDRPGHLARCLAALARLDPRPDRVMVVDNAPRLPCRAAVEAHGFDYVLEPRPGLDNARNRAIEQCQTDLIAFTDDDCVPVPAWLARLDRHFSDLSLSLIHI